MLTSILLQVINVGNGPEQSVRVDQSGLDTKPTALPVAAVESDEAQEAKRAEERNKRVEEHRRMFPFLFNAEGRYALSDGKGDDVDDWE